jgi:hypothetical protein
MKNDEKKKKPYDSRTKETFEFSFFDCKYFLLKSRLRMLYMSEPFSGKKERENY